MSNVDSIGIMDPAFFVGKNVIIKWINEFLCVNITKIEDMANGAYHCQLLDACFPGKVPLSKVNFGAKLDYEFVKNFKVLQDVFTQQGVTRHVDVAKLVKAKYQDNLEFCQWMKSFFDSRFQKGSAYDAVARREQAQNAYKKGHKHADVGEKKAPAAAAAKVPAAAAADKGKENIPAKPAAPAKAVEKKAPAAAAVKKPAATTAAAKKPTATAAKPAVTSTPPKAKAAAGAAPAAATAAKKPDDKEVEELNAKIAKLRLTIEGLEKERNFYFGKLRSIEVMCQTEESKDAETKAAVLKILYQTDDEEEFAAAPAAGAAAAAPAETDAAAEPAAEEPTAEEAAAEVDGAVAAAEAATTEEMI